LTSLLLLETQTSDGRTLANEGLLNTRLYTI